MKLGPIKWETTSQKVTSELNERRENRRRAHKSHVGVKQLENNTFQQTPQAPKSNRFEKKTRD